LVVEEGKAAQRPVQLGPAEGANVRIQGGLSAGDLVIVDPPADLLPGRAVSAEESAPE
jgi:multidrug efflux pump subunit AcrA (membrane-fusion protein)